MVTDCTIRPYEASDLAALAEIYRSAIRHLGPACYTAEQVAAWSSYPDDRATFETWLAAALTLVAVGAHGEPLGFAGLEPSGRIASLFVAPAAMRRGIGSALMRHLLAEIRARGLAEATTEASEFSRPLFEKFGFEVREIERNTFKGVAFTRYAMRLRFAKR